MKTILFMAVVGVFLISCNSKGIHESKESKEYQAFVKKYGSDRTQLCVDGFLIEYRFLYKDARVPQEYLVDSSKCLQKGQQ